MTVEVITNNVPRDLKVWEQLTEEQQRQVGSDYDYIFNDDLYLTEQFFTYKGHTYPLSEFLSVYGPLTRSRPDWLQEWHGYTNDTFFSGIVIRYPRGDWGWDDEELDYDRVIVGTYFVKESA